MRLRIWHLMDYFDVRSHIFCVLFAYDGRMVRMRIVTGIQSSRVCGVPSRDWRFSVAGGELGGASPEARTDF